MSNARKYGRPPYTLRVRAAADPAYVCLDVTDRGPGVPEPFRDQLFGEYTRAEGTTAEGVGLGLYVVHVLAEAQGGSVDYTAAPAAVRSSRSRCPPRLPDPAQGRSCKSGFCLCGTLRTPTIR